MELCEALFLLPLLLIACLCLGFGALFTIRRRKTCVETFLVHSRPRPHREIQALILPKRQTSRRQPTLRCHFCPACGKPSEKKYCGFCDHSFGPILASPNDGRSVWPRATVQLPNESTWAASQRASWEQAHSMEECPVVRHLEG